MPAKAGQIVIDVQAGTAKMLVDLQSAKVGLREFGAAGQGSARMAANEMRILEGNITNNTRAVSMFIVQTLKLGPAVQAMAAGFGAIAAGGMVWAAGNKVYDFFKGMEEAPKRIGIAFRELAQPITMMNDALAVSNLRLQAEIDKLQGKRENTVALALAEAKEAADKLSDSLDKDIDKMSKLLKENGTGFWESLITGAKPTGAIKKYLEKYRSTMADPNVSTDDKLKAASAAQEFLAQQRKAAEEAQKIPTYQGDPLAPGASALSHDPTSQAKILSLISQASAQISREVDNIKLSTQHASLEDAHTKAQAAAEESRKQAEAAKKQLDELNQAVQQNYAARAEGLERLGLAQEANDVREEAARVRANNENPHYRGTGNRFGGIGEVNDSTFDLKAASAYAEQLTKLMKLQEEADDLDRKFREEVSHGIQRNAEEQERETKQFEEEQKRKAEAMLKVFEATNRLRAEIGGEEAAHRVRMIGIQGGSDPIATLKAQQAIERQQIEEKYQGEKRIADLQHDVIAAQNAELEKRLAIAKLDDQMAEERARRAQQQFEQLTGGLTSGVANQLANAATGQKTDFGKMLQGVAHQLIESNIKKALDEAMEKLFHRQQVKKPTGNPGDPIHVVDDSSRGRSTGGGVTPGGILGRIGGVLGTSVGKFPALAEGTDSVDPGQPYWVGDGGEPELFTPKSAGSVTPASKLGGGGVTVVNHVDARNADLGAGNRVRRALDATHQASVRSALAAQAEQAARRMQRT